MFTKKGVRLGEKDLIGDALVDGDVVRVMATRARPAPAGPEGEGEGSSAAATAALPTPPKAARPVCVLSADGKTVKLANGVDMPLLGLGTSGLSGSDCREAVELALERGWRHLFCDPMGNETAVKAVVETSSVPRHELFLSTLLTALDHGYEAAHAAVDRSLKQLGVEAVDLMVVHWPGAWLSEQKTWTLDVAQKRCRVVSEEMRRETWRALEERHRAGHIRALGVANYTQKHLEELLGFATVPPAVYVGEHHPYHRQLPLVTWCKARGIMFMAHTPLGGAVTHENFKQRPVDDDVVAEIADRLRRTPAQVALRWSLQDCIAVVPRAKQRDHLAENAASFDFDLSDNDLDRIDRLDKKVALAWDPAEADSLDPHNPFLEMARGEIGKLMSKVNMINANGPGMGEKVARAAAQKKL